jgi:dTDP-N-acetylfucosamine:lipid II N-acetylfucosaminyltransferase
MSHITIKLIHIFSDTPHHYIQMQRFLKQAGGELNCEQIFLVADNPNRDHREGFEYFRGARALLELMHAEPRSTKFIFHGLFNRELWRPLCFSKLPERCSWVCWGSDLYQHKLTKRTWKRRKEHFLHKILTARFETVIALNDGDGKLIKQILWNVPVSVLPYPLLASGAGDSAHTDEHKKIIMIGNSGTPDNEHIEALNWLAKFAANSIEIVAPLNYGGTKEYVQEVIEKGLELFGDKFTPITAMLLHDEYDKLLASVDTAVFAHKRQQGLYVVYSMLKHGRKMFIRSDTSSFAGLTSSGFTIFPSEKIAEMTFEKFMTQENAVAQKNSQLMNEIYSEEALLPKWSSQLTLLIEN